MSTTSNTTYNVTGGTTSVSGITSPFEAIGIAYKYGGKVTESNAPYTVIYEKGSSKYYLFQFTNFYKAVNTEAEALQWVSDYSCAHAISGQTGTFVCDTGLSMKGGFTRIENNVGAYFYNFSHADKGYKSIETTVSLSKANLRFSDKTLKLVSSSKKRADNAFVYLAAISEYDEIIEAGIIFDQYCRADKKWKSYSKHGANGSIVPGNAVATTSSTSNIFRANRDIKIKMSLLENNQAGIYYKITTTDSNETILDDGIIYGDSQSQIRAGKNVRFLVAASFVHDFDYENLGYPLGDIRDGAYFKNIILNSYAYTSINQSGSPISLASNGSATQYSYIYNTDAIDYTRNGNAETINIYYDKAYTS